MKHKTYVYSRGIYKKNYLLTWIGSERQKSQEKIDRFLFVPFFVTITTAHEKQY